MSHNLNFAIKIRIIVAMPQVLLKEKILFIINPNSGTRFKGDLPEIIQQQIDKAIFDVEVLITRYKGEATEIVQQKLTEGYCYFIAVGGDGTVNEIAKVLINTQAILGIIPVGSGNGLARHLKIPLTVNKALQIINNLKTESIDCGIINSIPFFCTCGVGFDALIGEKFDQKKRRGLLTYIKTVFSEFFNYNPETYRIVIDNEQEIVRNAFLITFANASQYGNNAFIAPKADIYDGKLDLCILSPFRFYTAPFIGMRLFTGKIDKSSLVFSKQARKIVLKREGDGIIHIDGETLIQGKDIELSVVSRGLRVLIP